MNPATFPHQIEAAVDAVIARRPAYKSLLEFYGQLFIAQERSKQTVRIDPILLSPESVASKLKAGQPLIRRRAFRIDGHGALDLFGWIYLIARDTSPEIAEAIRVIWEAVEKGNLRSADLFTALLGDDDRFFDQTARALDGDKRVLTFITYSSANPSITACAGQLARYLTAGHHWDRGHCPVCGSPPALCLLTGAHPCLWVCSFCWHKWPAPQLLCPFCGSRETRQLEPFSSDAESHHGVSACNHCGTYIKTIDTRHADLSVYPPLEQVSTLYLDIQAMERGLKNANPSFFRNIIG